MEGKKWLENKYKGLKALVMDPFGRDRAHNEAQQKIVQSSGGADVVTSVSVLNVIATKEQRLRHCCVLYDLLKPGGVAFFKVWAGSWPQRGSACADIDAARNVYQANAWASYFRCEIEAVFGTETYVDQNLNLVVARKSKT